MATFVGWLVAAVFFVGMFFGFRYLIFRPGKRWRGFVIIVVTITATSLGSDLFMVFDAKEKGFASAADLRAHNKAEQDKKDAVWRAERDREAAKKKAIDDAKAAEKAAKLAAEKAKKAAEEAKAREHGHHCLSAWDGSHLAFAEVVKEQLRDPASFEHIDTITGKNVNESHIIKMKYRARNGFGGMNVATAVGLFDAADCKAVLVGVE